MPLPRILRLDKWNNPEDSIGTFIGYLRGGRYHCWEVAGPARLAFEELGPAIKDLLETSNIPPTGIVAWSMYMVGHNERKAAPKILICSADEKTRKNIKQLIRDSPIMDKYPGIGLGDVSALPDRPAIRELSREAIEALLPFGCGIDGAVLAEGPEPALGKRIFVVNPHDFSLRPATTGPIILHGDKCYQLTVAHAFRHTEELDLSFDQQIAEDDCEFDGMSDAEIDEESQYDEMTRKGSATPGEIDSDKASFMASFDAFSGEKHSNSSSESPSSDHLHSGHDPRLNVESPEGSPVSGEADVSQLQFFGRLVLSSLTGSNPSLDYALIETSRMPEDTEKSSMIRGSLVPSIGEIESDDVSVVATTSPGCRVEGRLTATPSYIRLSEQRNFQKVYPIRLGKPVRDGDCGSAVFGKDDNRFCGHIVAGGPRTSIAYLVPAGEIFEDIQARFGFGLMWMPQKEEQGQCLKNNPQRSPELFHGSRNSGVTSIKNLGTWEPEESQCDRHLESILVQQQLQQQPNSQPSQNTFTKSGTMPERKTRYHCNRKHDEVRPADSLPSRDRSNLSIGSIARQTRSKHKGTTALLGQQPGWPRTSIDASSSSSDITSRRQNSDSTDDIQHGLPKRLKIEHHSPTLPHMFPASVDLVQSATAPPLKALVDPTQGVRRRTRDIPSWLSHNEPPSSSSAKQDETAGSLSHRSILPEDFESACETCIFWLFDPKRHSSTETQTCRSRKREISQITKHIADHHGLIRGRDPNYTARKYLASCHSYNPFIKAKGDCVKCSSLSEWDDRDFSDSAHYGLVICLRCWSKFDKRKMKEHMAGPLCDYNAAQPKAQKLWTLYTAFCSETRLPSKPPQNMPPRKSADESVQRTKHKYRQQFGQDHTAAPVSNLDATMPPPDTKPSLPQWELDPPLVSSTAEESMGLWRSPKLDELMWFSNEASGLSNVNRNLWDLAFAATVSPLLQLTDRQRDLEPKGEISAYHRADTEKDSGYRSADEDI